MEISTSLKGHVMARAVSHWPLTMNA